MKHSLPEYPTGHPRTVITSGIHDLLTSVELNTYADSLYTDGPWYALQFATTSTQVVYYVRSVRALELTREVLATALDACDDALEAARVADADRRADYDDWARDAGTGL